MTEQATRARIAPRNYGKQDGEGLGYALNNALTVSWRGYRADLKIHKEWPYYLTEKWLHAGKFELRTLCRLRRIARMGK